MNWKQILRLSGGVQSIIGAFMLIPTIIAAVNGEWASFYSFLITLGIILVYVVVIRTIGRTWRNQSLAIRDVFMFVTLTWVVATALGALPLYLTGSTTDYSSAYMEIMSGFTTTGLTTIKDVEALPMSILFWRSLTHWIGGMGIVVLFVALLPMMGVEGFQLFGAEAVGPTKSKLVPRIKDTALILWIIYLGLTILEVLFLIASDMPLFDALTITFGSVATGGFSIKNTSLAWYNSAYVEVVVTVSMVLAGVNFSLYFALLKRRFRTVYKDTELRIYLMIFACATLLVTLNLYQGGTYPAFGEALRHAAFQTASIMTTTGFATVDFGVWPFFSQAILLVLMFVGGSAGSTGGGIKVTRIVTMVKLAGQNMRALLHPKGVFPLHDERETISWKTVNSIAGFIVLYLITVLGCTLVVAFSGSDLLTAFTAALISVGNIGLGLGEVGPSGSGFALMPAYVKWVLSFGMLVGRLEIYTVFALFTKAFWHR